MPSMFRSQFAGDFAVGLIGHTEFIELSSLPELPLDLDMPPTFLDQVRGFVALRTRMRFSLMKSSTKDAVSPVVAAKLQMDSQSTRGFAFPTYRTIDK